MSNRIEGALLVTLMSALFGPLLFAQTDWHGTLLRGVNNVPMFKLSAIAIPAEAEYRGQKFKAYVFIYGHEGRSRGIGYPEFGMYIENIKHIVPEQEIDQFVGPDLPSVATENNALQLNIQQGRTAQSISTRLVFTTVKYFDVGFETDGFLETNIKDTKSATDDWKQFLAQMSDGFEDGKAVIGGKAFSSELTVRFSGKGWAQNSKS